MRNACLFFLVACVLLPASRVMAHPEGFSGMHVTLSADGIRVAITVHTRDLGDWFPPARYPDYVADVTAEMERTAAEMIELQFDGQAQPIDSVKAFLLEVGLIEIDVDYTLPSSTDSIELLIWSKHLIRLPRDHQQFLFVEDRRPVDASATEGDMLLDDVLSVERDAAAVMLSPMPVMQTPAEQKPPATGQSAIAVEEQSDASLRLRDSTADGNRKPKVAERADGRTSRISFFRFGVEHIITGYDHLLFLAALLLTCATFSQAATIVTCFTLAHSVTLALAALDVMYVAPAIVEPAIALSIVYVAVENVIAKGKPSYWHRATVTCLFGLIHGLGFASALRDIGLRSVPGGVLWPLLKFNLGVEAGQLCVAVVILPLLLYVRRKQRISMTIERVGSIMIACLGGYWLATRLWPF